LTQINKLTYTLQSRRWCRGVVVEVSIQYAQR